MSLIDTFDEDEQEDWNPNQPQPLNYQSNNNNAATRVVQQEQDALFRLEKVGYKPAGLKHMV